MTTKLNTVQGNFRQNRDALKKLYEGIISVAEALNELGPVVEETERLLGIEGGDEE